MEILAVIVAVVAAFIIFRFVAGMIKFALLAAILVAVYLFMTGGFGA